ncbi:hypothetical protein CSB09_01065 [Candidatus Gracilibacteria bacterium]|nr:MAG: hypothetical protein CSB09_01065 [Candidatus Gracilibacteria bacterium]
MLYHGAKVASGIDCIKNYLSVNLFSKKVFLPQEKIKKPSDCWYSRRSVFGGYEALGRRFCLYREAKA